MDLLKLVKDKCNYFSDTSTIQGLRSIISHIEIAERHFEKGKQGEDYLFTDVIYRSNQAYEGSLKEAYRVITDNQPEKLSTFQIEKYFENGTILKDRVLALFVNYRQEWRNKSTHDYTLYFSEQEAFLAIVNVYAFFNILLDQMIEKKAYNQEKTELSKSETITLQQMQDKSLVEQVIQLLIKFSDNAPSKMVGSAMPMYLKKSLIGSLDAYIDSADEQIEVITEYAITDGDRKLYADMLIRKGESSLLIEIKNPTKSVNTLLNPGKDQLLAYMNASGINDGILYIPPRRSNSTKMETKEVEFEISDEKKRIVEIFPEKM
ncbi:GxxExxY protein [Methanosarcina mazei]|uniref:Uncharacterized protein n=1 Tax=Methanosarcina mazei SarPi TaxID=1434115 RepID=A0A0E3LS94_METMZ|nr:hypothetical protein [Methanosarcina mazei]AKB61376.1 hypothetical protein MSMAP_1391 [Methanosarcina mazei SarPi]